MQIKKVLLTHEYLNQLVEPSDQRTELHRAYFSPGSLAYCLVDDGQPVFAGGVVNMLWNRGEAWMLPTPWFHKHVKTCLRFMRLTIPEMAAQGGFKRIQATCSVMVSSLIFGRLGFEYEGLMKHFGPNGETCRMYARIFP